MLTWTWKLPEGTDVKLGIDPSGVESVWVGPRLVSRSTPAGKPDGHLVRLPPTPTGVERPTLEIVFDRARQAPTLRADGQLVSPSQRPPAALDVRGQYGAPPGAGGLGRPEPLSIDDIPPAALLRERLLGAVVCFVLSLALGLYVRDVLVDANAQVSSLRFSTKVVMLCPSMFVLGLAVLVAPKSALEASIRARQSGGELKMGGAAAAFWLIVAVLAIGSGIGSYAYLTSALEARGYEVR